MKNISRNVKYMLYCYTRGGLSYLEPYINLLFDWISLKDSLLVSGSMPSNYLRKEGRLGLYVLDMQAEYRSSLPRIELDNYRIYF